MFAFQLQSNTGADGKPIFTNAKLRLVTGAATAACGDADGIVKDPRACRFKPATVVCRGGQSPGTCLTPAEAGNWKNGIPGR